MSQVVAGSRRSARAEPLAFWRQQADKRTRKGPRNRVARSRRSKTACRKRKPKGRKPRPDVGPQRTKRPSIARTVWERLRAVAKKAFKKLKDPRVKRTRRHLLIDIIVIAVCAVIGGAQDWKGIARWGRLHQAFLAEFLDLPHGIPSRDTFRRVLCRIDPDKFQKCFLEWTAMLAGHKKGRVLNIDGKTLRRSGRRKSDNPLHIVSVWASEHNLTLGQITVDRKSNEITAIPKLLEMLDIEGALITIDAMGCQKEIARKIKAGNGDYCLAVKGNQEHLYEDIADHFDRCVETDFAGVDYTSHTTSERGHGRTETREYYMTEVPNGHRSAAAWAGLRAVGMTVSRTEENGTESLEARYYIVSISYRYIRRFAAAVRGHWRIENSLHWIMDITFREDESRIQNPFGASNFSWLRRFATSLLKNEPTLKDSVKGKREEAGWSIDYLVKVLVAAIPTSRI